MSSAGPPPLHGDENRQAGIIATTFVVTVLACIAVALRMVTRTWIVRSVGWDDYTIVCAAIGTILGTALDLVEIHYGFGRHRYYLPEWHWIEFEKYSYGEWIQTFQTLMFTKISICFFLLRIPVEKYFIRPIQGAIIALAVSNVVLTLLWILQCNPVSKAWNKDTSGTCFTDAQLQRIIFSQAIISIVSDFLLALFPIALLWNVQIATRTKVGLCSLMGLGLFTAACCIVRTVMNWQNVNSDPTWASIDNWYWRSWEVSLGIIAACVPALRPAYKTLSASIASYRSTRKASDATLVAPTDNYNSSKMQRRQQPVNAYSAAARAASDQAHRAEEYGVGDEGLAMNFLPGDKKFVNPGIKKTTEIDVSGTSAHGSQSSWEFGDLERRSSRNKDFV